MISRNIKFKNFSNNSNNKNIKKIFNEVKNKLITQKNGIFLSLTKKYQYSYDRKIVNKYKKFNNFNLIGMGGSILGAKAINQFLKHKIKKNFSFVDNLNSNLDIKKKNCVNLIISKSGNTLETICNSNLFLNKTKNIFIVENNNNYLRNLAFELKSDIVKHNNFIGGRYSVLSEVGMLPAELMGLDNNKFKRLNYLINNKNFVQSLIKNVACTLNLLNKKNNLSIILNYDQRSENLFKWYQQLIAESLGKKSKGILPIISDMPKDNHSLMQFYLDGPKKCFYTFFSVAEKNSNKINSNKLLQSYSYLKNKKFSQIVNAQILATQNVFKKKKIPFRSFKILKRSEESLGELFCFFVLETILLGRALKVNPFDQPSVELIKKETKRILLSN